MALANQTICASTYNWCKTKIVAQRHIQKFRSGVWLACTWNCELETRRKAYCLLCWWTAWRDDKYWNLLVVLLDEKIFIIRHAFDQFIHKNGFLFLTRGSKTMASAKSTADSATHPSSSSPKTAFENYRNYEIRFQILKSKQHPKGLEIVTIKGQCQIGYVMFVVDSLVHVSICWLVVCDSVQ